MNNNKKPVKKIVKIKNLLRWLQENYQLVVIILVIISFLIGFLTNYVGDF